MSKIFRKFIIGKKLNTQYLMIAKVYAISDRL